MKKFNSIEKKLMEKEAKNRGVNLMQVLIEKANNYTNARKCTCMECGLPLEVGEGHAVALPQKGFSYRYLCSKHYAPTTNNYHSNDYTVKGTTKSTDLASTYVGCEIELKSVNDYNKFNLVSSLMNSYGHKEERDCTVTEEHGTLILQGIASLGFLRSVEKYGCLEVVNNPSCGAHIHASINNIGIVRRFYHSLFLPLNDYLQSLGSEELERVFGSDFRSYACPIDRYSEPTNHSNFINTQHDNTLEFRLPRITSARQYIECVKFWRKCVWYINSYFCSIWNESASREEKKALAQKVGAQLVQYTQYLVNGDYIKLSV